MTHENIEFKYPHVTIDDDGYFCMLDVDLGVFMKKLSDGSVAFTYPIIDIPTTNIKSMEYDGVYFWTLRNGAVVNEDVIIEKWILRNNTFILVDTFNYEATVTDTYKVNTFTLDFYSTTFSATVSGGKSYVDITDDYNVDIGTVLYLGPNSDGESEEVTVTGTISGSRWGLNFYTNYTYELGDPIHHSRYLWLFNDFSGKIENGALYKFDANTGTYIERYSDNEYNSVGASTFIKTNKIRRLGTIYALLYIKSTNLKFLNIDTMSAICTLNMDNIQSDESTVISVYDLCIRSGTIYRLQAEAMYYEVDYVWSTYNYQVSPLREFIDSITVGASPSILPSDGVNTAKISAAVFDQYAEPIIYKEVSFVDNNDTGFITSTPVLTYLDGIAVTSYKAGITPAAVTITATATQYD